MKLGHYVTVDDGGNLCYVSVDPSIYYRNPELCSLGCGDEFGLELNWNGALNPVYYNSVEELGRLACFKCLFFSLRAGSLQNRVCSFYSYERSVEFQCRVL